MSTCLTGIDVLGAIGFDMLIAFFVGGVAGMVVGAAVARK